MRHCCGERQNGQAGCAPHSGYTQVNAIAAILSIAYNMLQGLCKPTQTVAIYQASLKSCVGQTDMQTYPDLCLHSLDSLKKQQLRLASFHSPLKYIGSLTPDPPPL